MDEHPIFTNVTLIFVLPFFPKFLSGVGPRPGPSMPRAAAVAEGLASAAAGGGITYRFLGGLVSQKAGM